MDKLKLADAVNQLKIVLEGSGKRPKFEKGDPVLISKLKDKYKLTQEYLEFLANYNPKISTIEDSPFGYLKIYSAEFVEKGQEGYAYGPNKKIIKTWNKDWVVIANDSADPYILNLEKVSQFGSEESPIYYALHGQANWNPFFIASSFVQFLQIIAVSVKVRYSAKYFDKESFELTPEGVRILQNKITELDPFAAATGFWGIKTGNVG